MTTPPYIPETAPFNSEQRAWLNGFLAGVFSGAPAADAAADTTPATPLTIMFGTQTGTAEMLSRQVSKQAKSCGFAPQVVNMEDFEKVDLASIERLLLLTSTYGEGDMPDNAKAFWKHLNNGSSPDLSKLQFSVLALGDTNYSEFCKAGIDFDSKLEALGATRITDRVDCDVEYEEPFEAWASQSLQALGAGAVDQGGEEGSNVEEYSKNNPFSARLKTSRLLNSEGAAKETRHYEICLDGSGLEYEVGDALGVLPQNCPETVNIIVGQLGCDGSEMVNCGKDELALRDALLNRFDITKPPLALIKAVAVASGDRELTELLNADSKQALNDFLWGREIIDLLKRCPETAFTAAEFTALLRKMAPRLYSISSSPKAHPGEVHLTIGTVRYTSHGLDRKGVCSTFLSDRCSADTEIPVYIQKSHGFRLPEDVSKPVIMVGPGTGIAPFRAFLEERAATESPGKNWLLFGDQHEATDFYYRDQLEALQDSGMLTHLTTAFSRDQQHKIYVQDRMRENAAELWQWLEDGAHFYVCGDASRMAKDVDLALQDICKSEGNLRDEEAAAYVEKLRSDKRYQRDVY